MFRCLEGVVPYLVKMSARERAVVVQAKALNCLKNLASGERAH
jgi:hypothetical protein